MDQTTSRTVCRIILGLTMADGELHPGEERFLERLMERFGLQRSAVEPVVDPAEALAQLRSLPEATRHDTLALMVEAAAADGLLHPAERILIGAVADELGLPQSEVDEKLGQALAPR